jgi:predicted alpha/beta-fold hydrolase
MTTPPAFTPRPFRAPRWLRGPHAQTVGGKLLRRDPGVPLTRERLTLSDGDFVDLDLGPEPESAAAPLAVVLHGLEGSARRLYMRITYAELLARGIRPVGLNFRSCSGEPNRAPRLYHSGETGDLGEVVAHLRTRFPDRRVGAIGYSLGGNVLLKYLGETGEDSGVEAAAAVSVPYDLAAGAAALERGPMSVIYNGYFLRMLREKVRARQEVQRSRIDLPATLRARTLRQFDEAATAPLHGFADALDYYTRSSSGPLLPAIRVPTLLLHALDDPFLPGEHVPVASARTNPWIVPAFRDTGGHVGFIYGTPRRPRLWAEEEAARFLGETLAEGHAGDARESRPGRTRTRSPGRPAAPCSAPAGSA